MAIQQVRSTRQAQAQPQKTLTADEVQQAAQSYREQTFGAVGASQVSKGGGSGSADEARAKKLAARAAAAERIQERCGIAGVPTLTLEGHEITLNPRHYDANERNPAGTLGYSGADKVEFGPGQVLQVRINCYWINSGKR